MKQRKSNLLQRMMALLLSAALVTGIVSSNAAPLRVLAQEPEETQESVGGNRTGTVEEDIMPEAGTDFGEQEEPETEDTEAEDTKETVTEEVTEPETVSGSDAEPETVAEPQGVMRMAAPVAQAGDIASGTDWTIDADGKLTIRSDEGMTDWINNGKKKNKVKTGEIQDGVTSIGEKAFSRCSSLVSIEIPSSVTNIGSSAFSSCYDLASIEIPSSVTNIGSSAFSSCYDLASIEIPSSVTNIGSRAFYDCSSLASIKIPSSVKSIGDYVFNACSSLASIEIQDGVTSIEDSAFEGCSSLASIKIPSSVKSIGDYVFNACSSLASIEIQDGVTSIGSYAFKDCSSLASIEIPSSVTNIGDSAFVGCSSLASIRISSGVTNIEYGVFLGCSSLTSIEIPSSVTSIKNSAFNGCSNLASIKIPSSVKSIGDYVFQGCSSLASIEIPFGVEKIGWAAFQDCSSLASVEISSSVTDIGQRAFEGCSSLTSIEIPSSVKSIENSAFYGCSSLTSIEIPDSVTSIKNFAFNGCSSLASIEIPDSVTSIGSWAFNDCFSLTNVTMEGETPPSLGSSAFTNCKFVTDNTKGILVPSGKVQDYKDVWTDWEAYITEAPHEHSWASDWTSDETHHWHECTVQDCTVTDNTDKDGYGAHDYDDDSDTDCNICGYTRTLPDTQPPAGTIAVENDSWAGFLHTITFGLFFKETKQITITAEDTGSGVKQISYHIADSGMTEAAVKALGADAWTEGDSFSIDPDRKCVIYAKLTDNAGNVAYLSSNGLVFDAAPPVISGVTDGQAYSEPRTVTVTDALSGVESVTVNGVEVTLTDNQFALGTAEGEQTIAATDKAGNTAAVTVTVKSHTHEYGDWQHDSTQHWKACACGEETGRTDHGFGDWITDKEATAAEAGTKHRDCRTCGYRETETVPATGESHTHEYGDWQHDSTQHWKACACGEETGRTDHGFGDWITDKEATAAEAGTKHRDCRTCGYRETETVPATGTEPGTVTPEVRPGANAPTTNISSPAEELKDMLLTDEEKRLVQSGTDIRIVLEVQDAGSTVSDTDKNGIQQALNGFTAGQYLNIDLYKLIGESRTDITETTKKIRIVIAIPDSLKNTDSSRARTFAVIRLHAGGAELLSDMDDSADTITIDTDRFSTYAVVYKDAAGGNGDGNNSGGDNSDDNGSNDSSDNSNNDNDDNDNDAGNNDGGGSDSTGNPNKKDDEPKTGYGTSLELYVTLAMIAGFAYLLLYFANRSWGMTEENLRRSRMGSNLKFCHFRQGAGEAEPVEFMTKRKKANVERFNGKYR
ncbi:MAG: leucine-rich repeat domain-containing protein [Lachnoclostridium sp.]|nr:leucine-rich repeat domain-containing protein [Lachnoclostridium sp.]